MNGTKTILFCAKTGRIPLESAVSHEWIVKSTKNSSANRSRSSAEKERSERSNTCLEKCARAVCLRKRRELNAAGMVLEALSVVDSQSMWYNTHSKSLDKQDEFADEKTTDAS